MIRELPTAASLPPHANLRACEFGPSTYNLRRMTEPMQRRIRLSEAHARMRYSDKVEEEDVEEAARLIREALKESATDPTTGLIDVSSTINTVSSEYTEMIPSLTFCKPARVLSRGNCKVTFEEKSLTSWNQEIRITKASAGVILSLPWTSRVVLYVIRSHCIKGKSEVQDNTAD